jgi:hypothetical protein
LWRFWINRQVWNLVFGLIWEWRGERSRLGSGDEMGWGRGVGEDVSSGLLADEKRMESSGGERKRAS